MVISPPQRSCRPLPRMLLQSSISRDRKDPNRTSCGAASLWSFAVAEISTRR